MPGKGTFWPNQPVMAVGTAMQHKTGIVSLGTLVNECTGVARHEGLLTVAARLRSFPGRQGILDRPRVQADLIGKIVQHRRIRAGQVDPDNSARVRQGDREILGRPHYPAITPFQNLYARGDPTQCAALRNREHPPPAGDRLRRHNQAEVPPRT